MNLRFLQIAGFGQVGFCSCFVNFPLANFRLLPPNSRLISLQRIHQKFSNEVSMHLFLALETAEVLLELFSLKQTGFALL